MEQLSVEVDNLKGRVNRVEEEQVSSRKQRTKLFALADNLHKELHTMREERAAADIEKNAKLDSIQSMVKGLQKTDQEHNAQIAETQKTITELVNKEIQDKGLPSSGKKLYAGAGIAGAISAILSTLVYTVLEHLPEIVDTLIRILRELK